MGEITEITDVLKAVQVVLDYLSKKGIVVFTREIRSVFRCSLMWVVEIDSSKFTGAIMIKSKTGEIIKELLL